MELIQGMLLNALHTDLVSDNINKGGKFNQICDK